MSVMAGLNSSSSRRMKKSWAILDESDFLARFEKLEAIMSHNQSYATYRAKLQVRWEKKKKKKKTHSFLFSNVPPLVYPTLAFISLI